MVYRVRLFDNKSNPQCFRKVYGQGNSIESGDAQVVSGQIWRIIFARQKTSIAHLESDDLGNKYRIFLRCLCVLDLRRYMRGRITDKVPWISLKQSALCVHTVRSVLFPGILFRCNRDLNS
jgi:hypothetical protein